MTNEDAIKIITQVEDGVIIPRYRPQYECAEECITRAKISEALNLAIEALKVHEIGYRECSDALLKMWMDKVITDRQYYNIMGKLFLYWEHRKQEG